MTADELSREISDRYGHLIDESQDNPDAKLPEHYNLMVGILWLLCEIPSLPIREIRAIGHAILAVRGKHWGDPEDN